MLATEEEEDRFLGILKLKVHPLHRGDPELGVLSSQSVHPAATTCIPMLSYSLPKNGITKSRENPHKVII